MIFNNVSALLNQLSEDELAAIGVFVQEDGTIEGLPDFPFEYGGDQYPEPDDSYQSAVLPKDRGRNPIPSLMENINRTTKR